MLNFLSAGTDRCDVETTIVRSLGLHFGTLWEHFGIIWHLLGFPWGPLGAFWRMGSNFDTFPPRKATSFWVPFWHPKSKKSRKITKKQCPKSSVEKVCSLSPEKTAQSQCSIVKTRCFERSDILHLGGFWPPFGYLLESLWGIVCKKW